MSLPVVLGNTAQESHVMTAAENFLNEGLLGSTSYPSSYREISERAWESDALVQLKSNLAQLEDLHMRMHFMLGEISYLLIKRA